MMFSAFRGSVRTSTVFRAGCVTQVRGLKAVRKIFREKLPKYRNDLSKLPPLTKLLTENIQQPSDGKVAVAIELRRNKLEVYKQYMPDTSNTNLIEALFAPCNTDIDKLLRVIDCNLVTMNSFYIGVSFEAINDLIELGLSESSTITSAPEFKRLCEKAIFKLRFFESDELLKLIKCLSNVGVPEDTLIIQGVLQMTRHLINDFEVRELEALAATLTRIRCSDEGDKRNLLSALKKAIPISLKRKSELNFLPQE